MTDDFALLREYAASGSEEAFRTLVERHSGMVHGVATRVAGAEAAEEISQAVFLILARKAPGLPAGTVVGGWLYRTARFVALEALRGERRRLLRHEELAAMNLPDESESIWRQVAPLLESAMARLGEAERSAIVLRFLEGQSFAQVASALGITEAAAKMRVARGVEKLRSNLQGQGIVASVAALSASLTAHANCAAPAGLAQGIATAALGQATADAPLSVLVKGGLKAMAISKTKTTALVLVPLFLLCGGIVFEAVRPRPVVRTFEPMVGEWEGKIEMRGDGMEAGSGAPAAMRVKTSDGGRVCTIDLRMAGGDGQSEQYFVFKHQVDDSGRQITTTDDPQVALVDGPGKVIESRHDTNNGTWSAGFRAKQRDGRGTSECKWTVQGQELKIVRRDLLAQQEGGKAERYSIITMERKEPEKTL